MRYYFTIVRKTVQKEEETNGKSMEKRETCMLYKYRDALKN
jgi:hypothetical protein